MNKYLHKYDVYLTVKTPVFVGSGKEISKKEYIFLEDGNMGVLDMKKIVVFLKKKHLQDKFEDFFLNDSEGSFYKWLYHNRIKENEIYPYLRYTIPKGDTKLLRGTKDQIMEFSKDPYGKPYIPGSTLKGLFRTILLSEYISGDDRKRKYLSESLNKAVNIPQRNRNNYLKRDIKTIEANYFNTLNKNKKKTEDAVNDILSGFIVSDTDSMEISDLILCQRIEKHIDGKEKRFNVLRECLIPGTKIHFTLTIDESVISIKKEELFSAISDFNNIMFDCFISKFPNEDRPSDNVIYVGGGTGFLTKTIIYPLMGYQKGMDATVKIFENTKVPDKHKHYKDGKLGVSPHILKCTKYEGSTMQMGQCVIEIS